MRKVIDVTDARIHTAHVDKKPHASEKLEGVRFDEHSDWMQTGKKLENNVPAVEHLSNPSNSID
jgi:hypothetical protein